MSEAKNSCANCQFAIQQPLPPPAIQRVRVCKRFPPHAIGFMTQGGMQVTAASPIVADDEFCHEWKPKLVAVVQPGVAVIPAGS